MSPFEEGNADDARLVGVDAVVIGVLLLVQLRDGQHAEGNDFVRRRGKQVRRDGGNIRTPEQPLPVLEHLRRIAPAAVAKLLDADGVDLSDIISNTLLKAATLLSDLTLSVSE